MRRDRAVRPSPALILICPGRGPVGVAAGVDTYPILRGFRSRSGFISGAPLHRSQLQQRCSRMRTSARGRTAWCRSCMTPSTITTCTGRRRHAGERGTGRIDRSSPDEHAQILASSRRIDPLAIERLQALASTDSFTRRWGAQLEDSTYKSKYRCYFSEQVGPPCTRHALYFSGQVHMPHATLLSIPLWLLLSR